MNHSDVESLIITIDELIFSHTGEHLDDLQHEILEGVIDHQKYADIAQKIIVLKNMSRNQQVNYGKLYQKY